MPIVAGPGDPGTTIDLVAVWLNTADDLTDCMAFDQAGESLSQNTTTLVEARQLIGRRRMVRTGSGDPAEAGSMKFEQCDQGQVAWLLAHVGVLLCYRDHVGSKWFGFYKDLPREVSTTYPNAQDAEARIDVSLSMESITYSEAV